MIVWTFTIQPSSSCIAIKITIRFRTLWNKVSDEIRFHSQELGNPLITSNGVSTFHTSHKNNRSPTSNLQSGNSENKKLKWLKKKNNYRTKRCQAAGILFLRIFLQNRNKLDDKICLFSSCFFHKFWSKNFIEHNYASESKSLKNFMQMKILPGALHQVQIGQLLIL